MKRMPFIRPTEHCDQQIMEIDERICALIKQRKECSDNNPGFPLLGIFRIGRQNLICTRIS
ncbi:hypothetical protein D3C76_340100 [compost metagenome]